MKKALLFLLFIGMGFFAQASLFANAVHGLASESDSLIINGNFDDGMTGWESYIANFAGVSADVAVVDGQASITNIAGAVGETWHVQFNQILTQDQIGNLEVGSFYKLTFDASSDVDGRPLRIFFGQNTEPFSALSTSDITLSTDMKTYEVVFEVTQTFGAMKLGFEMGNSNDAVFIDNVSMDVTDAPENDVIEEVPIVAAPTPTEDAADVISIFSDAYTSLAGTDFNPNWGQSTQVDTVDIEGSATLRYSNFNYQGTEFADSIDASDKVTMHLDMWTANATSVNFFLISGDSQEKAYALPITAGEWVSYEIPLSHFDNVNLADIIQFKFDSGESSPTIYLDNLYFSTSGDAPAPTPDAPTIAAPTPTEDAADVISIFSDAYTSLAGTDFNPNWGQSTQVDTVDIEGSATLRYSNFNYQGTEFADSIDASDKVTMHLDMWTANATSVNFFLISGDSQEKAYALPITAGEWVSYEIPLSHFDNVNLADIIQFKFDGGESSPTIYLDNLYFSTSGDAPAPTPDAPTIAAPTPTEDAADVISIFSDAYTSLAGTDFNPNWGQSTQVDTVDIEGSATLRYSNFNYQGTEFADSIDASDKVTMHLDMWTANATSVNFFLISGDSQEKAYALPITAGEWVSYEIPLSHFDNVNLADIIQFKFDGGDSSPTIYLDNLYFSTSGDDQPVTDNLIINGDFEDGLTAWEEFIAEFAGVSANIAVVDGEAAITNINGTSDIVWHVQLNQLLSTEQIGALEVGSFYKLSFDARSDVDGRKLRSYFGEDGGGFVDLNIYDIELTTSMETYETVFEVTQTFGAMKVGFEMGLSNDDVFIDNVSVAKTDEAPDAPAPPQPDGFLVSDMVGEIPVEDGELFVTAGPNQVADDEDLIYRLFYAKTSDVPANPREAAEYEFGTTAGDGEGNDAFGFVLSGLEHGTSYTAWLYQYDTANEVFSEPAVGTAVSGGESDEEPIGDQLIINGDFEDGLTAWVPFIADFAGVSADVAVVDGEAAITNINGTSDVVWHVQLNQLFTSAQIAALQVGKNYKASFDARSDVDGRSLRMYFGQDGGAFTDLNITDIALSTDMETYEAVFQVTEKFDNMKFGFEVGLSNDNVFIDNVTLALTDEIPQVAPPMPDGFLASDMAGEEPVGAGEIFVSAGPNQTAEENIVYKMFYAITDEAPATPQEAAEHVFGSVADDGRGIGPFGFIIDGLEEGTEYTFWLYQFNTANELYSEPAIQTAVSGGEITSADDESANLPREYDLAQNYPNPFNPTTQIQYALPEAGLVTIQVYNVMGQLVATLINEQKSAGIYTVSFDASTFSSGVYLYRMQVGNNVFTRKMLLMK